MQPTSKKPAYHLYTSRFEVYMHTVITNILSRFPRLSHEAIAQAHRHPGRAGQEVGRNP